MKKESGSDSGTLGPHAGGVFPFCLSALLLLNLIS